jgi:DNA-binding transcriptional LysR family regulator
MDQRLPLNVPRLRILYELTRRGSVSGVADALWITPSAVSQQLATLEREVGVKLVERAGRGVQLTAAGRRLAEEAERVLAALDVAESAARELGSDGAGGPLRVAAFPSVVVGLLAPALHALRASRPDLAVHVVDAEDAGGLDQVRLGRADVAVIDDWGWDIATEPDGLTLEHLRSDALLAMVPAAHPLAGQDAIRWSDLAAEGWVVEHGSSLFTQQIVAHCRRAGFEPRIHARVRDLSGHAPLVAALGLVAILPATAGPSGAGVTTRPLTPAVHRNLMVVSRTNAGLPTTALLTELHTAAAS